MKKLSLLIMTLLFLITGGKAQMITTDPALAVAGTVIKIYYDSSKDEGQLHNYTSELYAHTGVSFNGGADWQKVIGTWGTNSTQPKLKYLGNYIYELDITPNVNTFYSLSPSDVVSRICLVIRSADGSKQTKPDIFINIVAAGLHVGFSEPDAMSVILESDKQLNINAISSHADSMSLFIDNKRIKSLTGTDRLSYSYSSSGYGEHLIKVKAWDLPSTAADSFQVYVRPPVITSELPSGLKDGINYNSDNSVTLVLRAPYKSFVFVNGDFTDWLFGDKGYMLRTPDGERYWKEFSGLTPGKEYRFQYFVDTTLYIADPYSEKILDKANDPFISATTYPGLIPYPSDTASGIVSVLKTGGQSYQWKTTGYNAPDKSNLTIYELLVRDFVAKHDYKTLIDTLDYLDNLGINAIELMPVNEFEGNLSWGYNPSFLFAPDKYYGPADDLKALIDSCHNRGIAVILDMVLNHSYGSSPFVQLYLDHYASDEIIMKNPNPWFNTSSPNTAFKFGADFNHESPATQELVDRVTSYWLSEYKVDGFRFDFTKGFTNTTGDGSTYDASRIAILKRMADKIWNVNPKAWVILEHFAPNSEEMELSDYGIMLWGNINYNFCEASMGYSSDLSWESSLARGWSKTNLVSYMESHDEERVMYKTLTWGNSSGSYNTKEQNTAINRAKLSALFLMAVPGPKMIWQFGELGYDVSIDYNGRTGEKPIKWEYNNDYYRHSLYKFYKLMNYLRKTQPVFRTNDYSWSLNSEIKRIQLNGNENNVVILGNFGVTAQQTDTGFPLTGKWYEYFSGDSIFVSGTSARLDLLPGEYRMYTTRKLPEAKLVIGIRDVYNKYGKLSVLTYPNPSSSEFTFSIKTEIPGEATVAIYDFSGKMIKTLRSDTTGTGSDIVVWDGTTGAGTQAPGGFYIVRISSGEAYVTAKIIKDRTLSHSF